MGTFGNILMALYGVSLAQAAMHGTQNTKVKDSRIKYSTSMQYDV